MGDGEKAGKPVPDEQFVHGGQHIKGQTDDVSARDSYLADIANSIDPDMGTPEGGSDPVEPQTRE
ncbi:hypothetical protein AR539_17220 [Arthrobacter sp. EPSL27]|nr:hypothetical protein AR539_17220 [Arthrobacter sp. EPSL27]